MLALDIPAKQRLPYEAVSWARRVSRVGEAAFKFREVAKGHPFLSRAAEHKVLRVAAMLDE